jgi:hypothetical protein
VMQVYNTQAEIGWQHFVRGQIIIAWGSIINNHLATQKTHKFNAEQWGTNLLSINWKYILQLWEARNQETHGDTPKKSEVIKRQNMIDEVLHIQSTHTDLPLTARQLISRDQISLRSMSTASISGYLYGAKLVAEAASKYGRKVDQQTLIRFIDSHQQERYMTRRKEKKKKRNKKKSSVTQVIATEKI